MNDPTIQLNFAYAAMLARVRERCERVDPTMFRELVIRGIELGEVAHGPIMRLIGAALAHAQAAEGTRVAFAFDGTVPPDGEVAP